jgi:murein tripeptide amidase MpaA
MTRFPRDPAVPGGYLKRGKHGIRLILAILLCGLLLKAAAPPGPKFGPAVHPTFSQLKDRLLEWEKAYPRIMELRKLGTTAQGRPLLAAVLTDPDAPADHKEHVLITALHCGGERSAATGIFYLMDWLLKGSPGAREILRGQVIAFMPVVNPDGYVAGSLRNSRNRDT